MLPLIAIELPQAPEEPMHVPALLEACSRVLSDGQCVLAGDAPPGEARATVTVTFVTQDAVRLDIEFHDVRERILRDIAFRPEDAEADRWRTMGLVIGTLAGVPMKSQDAEPVPGDLEPDDASNAPSPAPSGNADEGAAKRALEPARARDADADRDAGKRQAAAAGMRSHYAWVALAATVAPALEQRVWRLGAEGRAAWQLGVPFLSGGLAYARSLDSVDGLSASWLEGALGGGATLRLHSAAAFTPRVEVLLQRLGTSVVDSTTGDRDDGARWLPGVRLSSDLAVWVARDVALFAGFEGRLLAASTDVSVRGRILATETALGFGALLGLRYDL